MGSPAVNLATAARTTGSEAHLLWGDSGSLENKDIGSTDSLL